MASIMPTYSTDSMYTGEYKIMSVSFAVDIVSDKQRLVNDPVIFRNVGSDLNHFQSMPDQHSITLNSQRIPETSTVEGGPR